MTFAVKTTNVADATAGSITWYTTSAGTTKATDAPTGISVAVSAVASNAATVTVTAGASAVAGSYYFT